MAITDAQLTDRFAPVFAMIAAGAVEREADRRLPTEEVELLRDAGFGRIRVPEEFGGLGATLPQFIRQLIELGRADSNLPQLLRGHFAFVESRLGHPDAENRKRWFDRIVAGDLIGNAQSELNSSSFWTNATTVARGEDGQWVLSGKKFYSTGSLFADWIHTSGSFDEDTSADVLVATNREGVERIDDWDGFGQRLTGSGTTIFESVTIADEDVELRPNGEFSGTYLLAVLQLNHLATLAGIGKAAVDDAVAFVNQRERNLIQPKYNPPRLDPQIQQVIGRIASAAFGAEAAALRAAEVIGEAADAVVAGNVTFEQFDAADLAAFSAQTVISELVLGLATELFEVGGATAVTDRFRLDRHWRNARTLSSHNPAIYRQTLVGNHLLNGVSPSQWAADSFADARTQPTGA